MDISTNEIVNGHVHTENENKVVGSSTYDNNLTINIIPNVYADYVINIVPDEILENDTMDINFFGDNYLPINEENNTFLNSGPDHIDLNEIKLNFNTGTENIMDSNIIDSNGSDLIDNYINKDLDVIALKNKLRKCVSSRNLVKKRNFRCKKCRRRYLTMIGVLFHQSLHNQTKNMPSCGSSIFKTFGPYNKMKFESTSFQNLENCIEFKNLKNEKLFKCEDDIISQPSNLITRLGSYNGSEGANIKCIDTQVKYIKHIHLQPTNVMHNEVQTIIMKHIYAKEATDKHIDVQTTKMKHTHESYNFVKPNYKDGNDDGYTCPHCIFTTNRAITLAKHLRKHTIDVGNKDHQQLQQCSCAKCTHTENTASDFIRHTPAYIVPFTCQLCNFTTTRLDKLQTHTCIRLVTNKKTFTCSECKEFSCETRSNLSKHKRKKHKRGVMLKCEFCSYTTNLLSHLNRHKKRQHAIGKQIF